MLLRLGLGRIVAQIGHDATLAFGGASLAHIAAMQNEPMMDIFFKGVRHMLDESLLDFIDIFAGRKAGTVGNPKNMRVHGNRGLTKRCVEYHIGGLAADAGQGLQLGAGLWHGTLVQIEQFATGLNDMLGFGAKQADGLDIANQAFLAQIQ